jgi:hypothetical protein
LKLESQLEHAARSTKEKKIETETDVEALLLFPAEKVPGTEFHSNLYDWSGVNRFSSCK